MASMVRNTTRKVPSRKSTELELSEILVDGKLQIYPHVEQKGLLFLQFRNARVIVSAGPFIGLIPLTPSISIEVEPKLPISNLARVLDIARSSLVALEGADRLYHSQDHQTNGILEFLGVNLVDAMKAIQENGLHKEYVSVTEKTSYPRGKLLYSDTVKKCWSRGEFHRVNARHFNQTVNTAPNRILKGALEILLRKLQRNSEGIRQLVKAANEALARFPDAIGEIRHGDIGDCHMLTRTRGLPVARDYYYRALDIALLILSNKGIVLQGSEGVVTLNTFIINFEILFEEYLRRVLHARRPDSVLVQDGNKEGRKSLFDDRKQPPAQPDIVITCPKSKKRIFGEVKYKDKPSREDINQAITYALSYRTRQAILIHQNKPGTEAGPRMIGEVNGITLKAYAFNLDNDDLATEEERFARFMFEELNA